MSPADQREQEERTLRLLDFPVRCEMRLEHDDTGVIEPPCGIDPEWVVECRHCGRRGLICNRHAVQLAVEEQVTCAACLTTEGAAGDLFWVESLPGGRG